MRWTGDDPMRARRARVLAVDDEPVNTMVIEAALQPLGYDVVAARNAAEAVARMRIDRPDLVLLDVMMPGETGIELCERMRRDDELADVPVILVTALGADANRSVALRAGADDYVEKPVDIDRLIDRVRSALGRAGDVSRRCVRGRNVPIRTLATVRARLEGHDENTSARFGMVAVIAEAARESGGGHRIAELTEAMTRAAGLSSSEGDAGAGQRLHAASGASHLGVPA